MSLSFRSLLLVSGCGLILAACAGPSQSSRTQQSETTEQQKTAPSRAAQAMANLPRVTMLPPERAMRSGLNGPNAPGPGRLVGLDADDIQKMLGVADFKRRDPPAEIWQYRNSDCLLDVFLYLKEGTLTVTHVAARGRSVNQILGTECLLESLNP